MTMKPMDNCMTVVFAQQSDPMYGHRDAYENGKKVGQITVYVMVGAILIWGVLKLLRKR
jgi:hypothetical protein